MFLNNGLIVGDIFTSLVLSDKPKDTVFHLWLNITWKSTNSQSSQLEKLKTNILYFCLKTQTLKH